jgi:hypothetical protein
MGKEKKAYDVDWTIIKAEYLAGGMSYRKLAEKHGIPRRTLEDKAMSERWFELRGQVRGRIEAELPDVIARSVITSAQAWVEEVLKIASQMMQELEQKLSGTQKVIVNSQGDRVVLELPWLNKAQDLKAAASALAELDGVGRLALGLDKEGEETEADQDWDEALREIDERCIETDEKLL